MKIAFYINSIRHGGAERVISNLATKLSQRGHECVLVTSFTSDDEYVLGHDVKRISLFENKLSCNVLKRNFKLIKSLRQRLKEEKPDVLVSFMGEPNMRAVLASRGLKIKTVVSVRNDPKRAYAGKIGGFIGKHILPRADGCVFQTEEARDWFPKKLQKKSKIIFNQVDEVFYNTKFSGERHDIVTTGRLALQKNHELLIRAFASISDKTEDNLIIYGEGDLRSKLETLISKLGMEDRIFMPGNTKNVAETIKSAKLFVLSSDFEGMPNALMEAMALGLPCISTDCPCGGPRMLFGEENSEALIPVNNADELADKMLYYIQNESKLGLLSSSLQKKSLEFTPEKIIGEWDNYIKNVCNSNAGGNNEN